VIGPSRKSEGGFGGCKVEGCKKGEWKIELAFSGVSVLKAEAKNRGQGGTWIEGGLM